MDPLHGITLKTILEKLVDYYGFDTLGDLIKIKCFNENPTINSSLTFLRKTEWARKKVEELYVRSFKKFERSPTNSKQGPINFRVPFSTNLLSFLSFVS